MKIAITSQGKEMQSPVDPRFGRARWFIVTDTGAFEPVDNEKNLDAAQGAGIQAGRAVAKLGVEAVVTGNVGQRRTRPSRPPESTYIWGPKEPSKRLWTSSRRALWSRRRRPTSRDIGFKR